MSDTEPTLRDVLHAVHEVSRTVHSHTAVLDRHTQLLEEQGRKLEAHDKRFDGVDKRFDGVDKRFDGVDKRLADADRRFERIDHRFDEHADAVRALSASVREVWHLLGTMNRRNTERFDNMEMQLFKQREEFSALKGHVTVSIGVLKDLIEARDFRLDEHGRRLNALETPRPTDP